MLTVEKIRSILGDDARNLTDEQVREMGESLAIFWKTMLS